jgi:TonB family protein
MIRTVLFLLIFLAGCTAVQQTEIPVQPPELVKSAPLPPVVSNFPGGGVRFTVLILVLKDGTVGRAKMLESSGDAQWDSLALKSVAKWQFIPAREEGVPVDLWVRQPLRVQVREPIVMTLAALTSASEQEADSLYLLLEHGANFDSLALHSALGPREGNGLPRPVDISMFAPQPREEIQKLEEGQVSHPLRIGNRYIIYKRLKKEPA